MLLKTYPAPIQPRPKEGGMMQHLARAFLLLLGLALPAVPGQASADEITVFAAASLTSALNDAGKVFEQKENHSVRFSYASSSTLAKQIENGAPANLFLSADLDWMDYLDQRQLIADGTRTNLLGNRLVMIAPVDRPLTVALKPGVDLVPLLSGGLLATGDPDHVPVGKYARQAFEKLGVWKEIADRIARTDTVRAALALVERAECPLGVVYATDAAASAKVKVVGVFPEDSYPPIVYPAALVKDKATPAAQRLLDFLKSPAARPIFEKHGFTVK
jgi:molybdate transport system substrate-binding protein